MELPIIDPSIEVLAGTDLAAAWDRFEIFEALHHSMQICNPMTSDELDQVVASFDLGPRSRLLDIACGYGELVCRACERENVEAIGVDLSPWMITAALEHARTRVPDASIQWIIGEARAYQPPEPLDVAVCLGADWIWHGFNGTARSLSEMVRAGGQVAIGSPRLHHGADPRKVADQWGRIDTIDDMNRTLEAHGLETTERIDPDDAGWDAYLERTAVAAAAWAERFPGPRSDRWIAEQVDWHAARERDREIIGWSVWIARKH